jgi:hypothetical protein
MATAQWLPANVLAFHRVFGGSGFGPEITQDLDFPLAASRSIHGSSIGRLVDNDAGGSSP